MSLLKEAIRSLVNTGQIEHEETIQGTTFVFRNLQMEEQLLVDSTANLNSIKEKFGAKDISTYPDTLVKLRNLSILSFSIKEVNGVPPVDLSLPKADQYKQRQEFREELSELSPVFIDELLQKGYNKVFNKTKEFYSDIKENAGK